MNMSVVNTHGTEGKFVYWYHRVSGDQQYTIMSRFISLYTIVLKEPLSLSLFPHSAHELKEQSSRATAKGGAMFPAQEETLKLIIVVCGV